MQDLQPGDCVQEHEQDPITEELIPRFVINIMEDP